MNILLLGSGGREHAFALKFSQSKNCSKLYIAPGNAGTANCGTNLNFSATDFEAIKKCCIEHKIEMVVVGPEDPLVKGIYDFFLSDESLKHIPVIGPSKAGAQLEGSKDFAKAFMQRHNIPTAAYQTFTKETLADAYRFLESLKPPYVLKADGLAAGKGVVISSSLEEAKKEITEMLTHEKFGSASAKVVIEEFLTGIELSVFILTDGKSYVFLPEAKDYKRIGEGDKGLNTGGMGAVSPVPFAGKEFMRKVEEKIVKPTVDGLRKENIPYKGFIFIGLMAASPPNPLSEGRGGVNPYHDPFVIEYNCRMGDPETEVVLPRIKNDLVELLQAVGEETLSGQKIEVDERTAVTVMMVSGGYPEAYEKGKVISGLEHVKESLVFHAGTGREVKSQKLKVKSEQPEDIHNSNIVTSGGRVLTVTSFGKNISEAASSSYQSISKISFEKMYYRKDIGKDLLEYEKPVTAG
ncbi:MAG: phosphoribosylamine--glycine ligase [Bacteroidetes bacterium]|nr:phosphoribosylamine--glycine ligase [Bacteroidota bacterium]